MPEMKMPSGDELMAQVMGSMAEMQQATTQQVQAMTQQAQAMQVGYMIRPRYTGCPISSCTWVGLNWISGVPPSA